MTTNIDEIVNYNGKDIKIRDLPMSERPFFGYGHFPSHIVRPLIPGDWPYTPSTCLEADSMTGVWVDDEHLACTGCGADFT